MADTFVLHSNYKPTGDQPQAVLCAYDDMAHGVLRCAHDYGLRVPQDFVVVGRNNVSGSAYTVPSLTSIDYCLEQSAEVLAGTLCRLFACKTVEKQVTITATVAERESTGFNTQAYKADKV